MARILIKKPESSKDSLKQYLVRDTSKDYHMEFGFIKKDDLAKPDGTIVTSNTGKEFSLFTPTFMDLYSKVTRGPQMIPLKDIGTILTLCGLGKESIVVEGGAGSGGLSCVLAHVCKEVYSYDINEKHLSIVEKNKKNLNLQNLTLKHQDMTKQIDETNVDAVIIDLPSPWLALEQVTKAVKVGGYIVSYSPNVSQVMEFCKQLTPNLVKIKTIEIIEREWIVDDLIVHPKSRDSIHSGFLTIVRRIT